MTGGGFGGCTVALVRADRTEAISNRIALEYEERVRIKPTLFVSRPAAGAVVLQR
jgi:galactokinase